MFRFVCLTFLSIVFESFAAPKDPVSAARERQEKFKTVLLQYRKIYHVYDSDPDSKPNQTTKIEYMNKLILSGEKYRHERISLKDYVNNPGIHHCEVRLCDGKNLICYYPPPHAQFNVPYPMVIRYENEDRLMLLFDKMMSIYLRGEQTLSSLQMEPTLKTEIINESLCVELKRETDGFVSRCWFDTTKDFLPVRIQTESGEGRSSLENMSYRQDAVWGWLPNEYTEECRSYGKLSDSSQFEIINFEINKPVADDFLQMSYIPGTVIRDERAEKYSIVEEDGFIRETTLAEINNPPGKKQPSSYSRWVLIVSFSSLVIVGALKYNFFSREKILI